MSPFSRVVAPVFVCVCAAVCAPSRAYGFAPAAASIDEDADAGAPQPEADAGTPPPPPTTAPPGQPSPVRGLLASAPFDRAPIKGVYFFPGEGAASNRRFYTAHPSSQSDLRWNSDARTRPTVVDRIAATHANTIVMSYWGDDMKQWSPMALNANSVRGLLDAVQGKPVVVLPALESGFDALGPETPHFRFAEDFPYADGIYDEAHLAPKVLARLIELVKIFEPFKASWAQVYDRSGQPRYAVQVLGAFAKSMPQLIQAFPDQVIAAAFDALALAVEAQTGMRIGFTLDAGLGDPGSFPFQPESVGAGLADAESVLAIQLFLSELRGGRALLSAPGQAPIDNNVSNLHALIDGKLGLLSNWRKSGLPVIYDVSPGYDGRFVWESIGTGFWGDNSDYTWDEWRNLQSENKTRDYVGLTYNTWNGYTEGFCAVPTTEHGSTDYDWLTELYAPAAIGCEHVEYQDGKRAFGVTGAICEKWQSLRGRRGPLGEPNGDVIAVTGGTAQRFLYGSIYNSDARGAHEIHGVIYQEYERMGYEQSCLGMPIADEEALPDGWQSRFERGEIKLSALDGKISTRCAPL